MHELMRTCTAQLHIQYLYTLLLLLPLVHCSAAHIVLGMLLLLLLGGVVHA